MILAAQTSRLYEDAIGEKIINTETSLLDINDESPQKSGAKEAVSPTYTFDGGPVAGRMNQSKHKISIQSNVLGQEDSIFGDPNDQKSGLHTNRIIQLRRES